MIANTSFGFQVSVEGAGYTWAINSQQHQITQWSNDPVTDRPGEVLYVQDLETGELWGPTALPIREDGGAVRRSSRPGLQHLRAHLARNFARADAVRATGRLSQDFAAEDSQSLAARATPVGHRLRRVGARNVARRLRTIHRHRNRPRNSRGTRAQLFQHRVRKLGSHSPTCAAIKFHGRRTERSFSAATARSTIPPRSLLASRCLQNPERRWIRARRCKPRSLLRPNAVSEVVFFLGEAASRPEAIALDQEISRRRPRRRPGHGHAVLGRLAGRGAGQDSGPLDGPHAQPMAAVSDACVPLVGALRVLPGGRRVRLSRSAPGRDGVDGRAACV